MMRSDLSEPVRDRIKNRGETDRPGSQSPSAAVPGNTVENLTGDAAAQGRPASRPSSPESAACRAESSASILKTMLLPAPASLGVLASLAPAAIRDSALAAVRFQTVMAWPDLLTRLGAM